MPDFRPVTDSFFVSPQISPADVTTAAGQGFVMIVNNRPDGESPDQPTSASIEAAAQAAGLCFLHVPVVGRASPGQVASMRDAIEAAHGKTLAYCRSGARSITTWAVGEVSAGSRTREEIVNLARAAGYDLSAAI